MMQEVNQDGPFPFMLPLYVSVSENQNKKCLLAFVHPNFTKLLVINERGSEFSFPHFAKIMDEWLQVYHEGG